MTPEEKDELAACRRSEDEVALVERLVLAERERCAKVVRGKARTIGIIMLYSEGEADRASNELAAAILEEPTDG